MLVSIIIPTLNREKELCEVLCYFLHKEDYRPFEIIVIDQGKKNNVEAINKKKQFFFKGIDFYYIKVKSFKDQYIANNYGARQAKGDVVLFLDDDVEPKKHFLKGHVLPYSNPKVKAVTGPILRPGQYLKSREHFGEKLYNDIITGRRIAWHADFGYYPRWAPGCNISFRKDFFQVIGGYDENFYGEGVPAEADAEIWTRANRQGMVLYYSPQAALTHKQVSHGGCRNMKKGKDFLFRVLYNRSYFQFKVAGTRKHKYRVIWRVFREEILNRNNIKKRPLALPLLMFYFFIGLIKSNKRLAKDLG